MEAISVTRSMRRRVQKVSSPLRSRLTPTMRLEVKRVGCSKPHQFVLSIDTSVRQLKEQLPETLTFGTAPNVFHLIYVGLVELHIMAAQQVKLRVHVSC